MFLYNTTIKQLHNKLTIMNKSIMAQNIFTAENLKLVNNLAKKIAGNREDLRDDLTQEGRIALLKAAETFNPSFGVPFCGYAYNVLKNAMLKALKNINQVVSVSLDEDEEDNTCSLIPIDGDEDYPQKDICDCDNPTPSESYELKDTCATVRQKVNLLPFKERVAVSLSFGLDGLYERSLECIADELGCSTEGARKICAKGLNRLRIMLSSPQYSLCAA